MFINKRGVIFWLIIALEIVSITLLSWILIVKQFTHVRTSPLQKASLRASLNSDLQYYYELPQSLVDYEKTSWLPYVATHRYNADGLHERYEYDKRKDPATYRIVTVGDSFVFGMWVNTEDNFSEILEDTLNITVRCEGISTFEVINLGASGFDVRYMAERYNDKGAAYTPDLVIWLLRGENLFMNMELYRAREEFYKNELKSNDSSKRYHVDSADQYAASTLSYEEYVNTYNALSQTQQEQFIQPSVDVLTDWTKQDKTPFLIATFASEEDRYKKVMKSVVQSRPPSWYQEIDAVDTFAPYDYHPNALGHKKIAQALFTYITSSILKQCVQR